MADEVRLIELLGALGLATDLAMGMPLEHAIRSTIIAGRIAARAGLSEEEQARAYYLCLMMFIGCTADVHFFAAFMGDEHAVRGKIAPHIYGNVSKMMRAMMTSLGSQESGLARMSIVLRGLSQMKTEMAQESAGHCEVAQMLSSRFRVSDDIRDGLAFVYERYDGKGIPGNARGDEIPRAIRVMHVARDVETQLCFGNRDGLDALIQEHAGGGLDPDLASVFLGASGEILDGLGEGSAWQAFLHEEPGEQPVVHDDDIDEHLRSMGEFVDFKTPFTLGHSAALSDLVDRAADAAGFTKRDRTLARRAAFVADIGRVTVPVLVLEKPGRLSAEDLERMRLHAYQSERILARGGVLASIGSVAGMHHERLDGSGYHRGCRAELLSPAARLLAAADTYRAMIEPRPYRPAYERSAAAAELRDQVNDGKLDARVVVGVLEAADHRVETTTDARAASLTDREVQVLRLLGSGLLTKQIARRLGVSPKTVDNHLQHIYPKLGVSTRAGATLYAARTGLLA